MRRWLMFVLLVAARLTVSPGTVLAQPTVPVEVQAQASASIVRVLGSDHTGSGVQIDAGLLSSSEVVGDDEVVQIVTSDGRRGSAHVTRTDASSTLALLQPDLPIASPQLEPTLQMRTAEPVLVLGYSRGQQLAADGTTPPMASNGLIAALQRDLNGISYLQTDVSVPAGNLGGAVLNARGRLIGVPALGLQADTLDFAVSAETIQAFLAAPQLSVPVGPNFVGNLDEVGLQRDDLGLDWHAVASADLVADQWNLGPMDRETAVRSAFTQTDSDGASIVAVVWSRPTAQQAHADYLRQGRGVITQMQQVGDPGAGDECKGWQGTAVGGMLTLLVCRVGNVVLEDVLVGSRERATYEFAAAELRAMAQRARDRES